MALKDCSHCGATPRKCEAKQDAAVEARKSEQARRWPNLTPQQARDDLTRAAHMNSCCANCSHF